MRKTVQQFGAKQYKYTTLWHNLGIRVYGSRLSARFCFFAQAILLHSEGVIRTRAVAPPNHKPETRPYNMVGLKTLRFACGASQRGRRTKICDQIFEIIQSRIQIGLSPSTRALTPCLQTKRETPECWHVFAPPKVLESFSGL